RSLLDVIYGSDRGGKDLGREVRVIVEDHTYFADQLHSVEADVVETADEWRDKGRTGLGCQQGLIGREAESHIHHSAFRRECPAGFEAIPGQRHLDADVLRESSEYTAFGNHALIVSRGHLGADRPRHDL